MRGPGIRTLRTAQVVLAAGRSERMGRPKPLLPFDGRSALDLVLGAANVPGVMESVVVVGATGAQVMAAQDLSRCPRSARWALNLEPGAEQLRSLQIGLGALSLEGLDGFFAHPVDHPLATARDYQLLLEALAADETEAAIFILSHGGRRGHPVLCRSSVAPKVLALSPEATLREVIERERLAYVITDNAGVREDMDTWEDYERVLRLYRLASTGTLSEQRPPASS